MKSLALAMAALVFVRAPPVNAPSPSSGSSVLHQRGPAGIDMESLPPITSELNVDAMLSPAWGSGAIPVSAGDDTGAFRLTCGAGHINNDDPLLYPNQPGRAHLHQFFGNSLTNASSTYDSLRRSGESTCNNALARSAYWIPALMVGNGKVERPDYVTVYYKRLPKDAPEVSNPRYPRFTGFAVGMPNGLRAIMGRRPDLPASVPQLDGDAYFNCDGPGATGGHYKTLEEAAPHCPIGARVGALTGMNGCWNGKLDSPDHRSHLTGVSYGGWGYPKCPDTHPYVIPIFFLGTWYMNIAEAPMATRLPDGRWRVNWRFSSDGDDRVPGSTFHADFMEAWEPAVKTAWEGNCIDKRLNCSGGDLGNGKQVRLDFPLNNFEAKPRFVDAPKGMPGMAHH